MTYIELQKLYNPFNCRDFTIQPVYQRLDPVLAGRILNLWQRHRILPQQAQPTTRLKQVVCVAFDPFGELAALNTAFVQTFDGQKFYRYRLFIRPQNGNPDLRFAMTKRARELLRRIQHEDPMAGLMIVLENPKLRRDEVYEAMFLAGYRKAGLDHQGRDVWVFDFD